MVTIHGVDVHPGHATGKLVSAVRLAADIVAALPSDRLTPDTTSGREGFIHVYSVSGTAAVAEIRAIVRDFDEDRLAEHVALFERTAREVMARAPRATLDFQVRRQYRNMREYIDPVPFVVEAAEAAIGAEGARAGTGARPRRHRRLPALRDGSADAQHLHRRPRVPLRARMGLAPGHGLGGGDRGPPRRSVDTA